MIIHNINLQDNLKATSITNGSIEEKDDRDILCSKDYNTKYAATMEISKEGHKKAQKLIGQADIPKGTTEMTCNNYKTFQNMIDTVKNGGILSKEEKERICMEMQREVKIRYRNAVDLRLESDDERVLKEMKDDYLLKQYTLAQMQEKVQEEKIKEDTKELQKKNTENANRIINKMKEIEVLNESLNIDTSNKCETEEKRTEKNNDGEKKSASPLQKAIVSVEKKEESVRELEDKQILAANSEKECEKLLTLEYENTISVLENKEISIQDKVKTYERFKKNSAELAIKREVERHRKIFYYEARLEAKSELLSNQEISDARKNINELLEAKKEMLVDNMGQAFIQDKLKEKI